MKSGRYSLAQLLDSDSIEQIIIPEMQRDYVWKAENVERLLGSIGDKWSKKESMALDIKVKDGKDSEGSIETSIHDYLTKEYERLRFNTRIGFIYAYYDASDSRRLYLIDGQQRITTLFLLLLAIYSQTGKRATFLQRYMRQGLPRLDYRVRECAHTFLVDFIGYILDHPHGDFRSESERYYSIYANDPTVKSILANFDVIRAWVKRQKVAEPSATGGENGDFIDYVENFIEFNYFDTGRSRQGERLYLYMNSRGEQLSQQEQIRPTIIQRSEQGEKLNVGRAWERWQDFFWKHRDTTEKNANADAGFNGFLKVAAILHQYRGRVAGKEMTMEDKVAAMTMIKETAQAVSQYIQDKDNEDFNFEWMNKVFTAYEKLSDIYADSERYAAKFIRNAKWRSAESIKMIHYIPLCGTLLLAIRQPDISAIPDLYLYRLAMYLLCQSDSETNSKSPDFAIVHAMDLACTMCDKKMLNITDLAREVQKAQDAREKKLSISDRMNDFGSQMWRNISASADGGEWENVYWKIIGRADEESEEDDSRKTHINRFFNGTHDLLFRLASDDADHADVETISDFIEKFRDRFSDVYDVSLRKNLLHYGDISILNNEKTNEKHIPIGNHSDKPWRIYADWRTSFENNTEVVRNYVDGDESKKTNDGNLIALAKGLDYMNPNYYKFFRNEPDGCLYPDIVLVQSYWTDDAHRKPLPYQILEHALFHTLEVPAWYWTKGSKDEGELYPNAVVVEFNEEGVPTKQTAELGSFALDFVYKWDERTPSWDIYLVLRPADTSDPKPAADAFDSDRLPGEWDGTPDTCKLRLTSHKFADTQQGYDSDGMLQSVTAILEWFKEAREGLKSAYMK